MADFTIKTYNSLIEAILNHGFSFQTFNESLKTPQNKSIILRHDVDLLPENSLLFAQIEHKLSIKGSYYFRAVPESWDERIIKEIHELGHEIGYHYENLTTCNGDMNKAIEDFKYNLEKLCNLTAVSTICMHGSPRSKWDSKDLWKKYNYKDFGIIGEPYFDIDFSNLLYLTDTGRRWNGERVIVRDKAIGDRQKAEGIDSFMDWVVKPKPRSLTNMTEKGIEFQSRYNFRSTNKIIRAVEMGKLPDKIMMTFHPQRWTDRTVPWVKELVWQNIKNIAKYFIVKIRQ